MQRLLKIAIAALVAGTLVAISPCIADEKPTASPAKAAEAKAPQVADEPIADGYGWQTPGTVAKSQTAKDEEQESSTAVTVVRFIGSLALVLGLCYVCLLGLKKFSNVKGVVGSSRNSIQVVENTALGANRTLHIVKIGAKRFLVASTPTQVTLLSELEESDVPESAPEPPPTTGFKEHLAQFIGTKVDSTQSAKTVAQMMRESSSHIQGKVGEVGSFRRIFRNANNG